MYRPNGLNESTRGGPSFLAALLEWVLGSYSAAFERIEQRLEVLDAIHDRVEKGDTLTRVELDGRAYTVRQPKT